MRTTTIYRANLIEERIHFSVRNLTESKRLLKEDKAYSIYFEKRTPKGKTVNMGLLYKEDDRLMVEDYEGIRQIKW